MPESRYSGRSIPRGQSRERLKWQYRRLDSIPVIPAKAGIQKSDAQSGSRPSPGRQPRTRSSFRRRPESIILKTAVDRLLALVSIVNIDYFVFDRLHPMGECATRPIAQLAGRLTALPHLATEGSRGRSCVLLAPCQTTRQPHTRARPTAVSRMICASSRLGTAEGCAA